MSTVGINFGSATSGTGFDVASTVASIMAIQRTPETAWAAQTTALKAQDTALTALGTDLSNLSTALSALTAFDGAMSAKSGASSDTTVATLLSADFTARAGTHILKVGQLAQTSAQNSDPVAATDTLSGTFTFQVGNGKATTITLDSTNNTLAGLAAAINASGAGVTADVVTGTSGSRISLISQTSGVAGNITVSGALTDSTTSSAVNFNVSQAGQDAAFTIDGIDMTSSSNTVSTAIPGVTMQLLSVTPTSDTAGTQIQIVNDTSTVSSALNSFVTAYNQLITDMATQEGKDSTGAAEPLYGSSVLSQIQSQISLALGTASSGSGSMQYLTQLGITTNTDGTLSLDSSQLSSELSSDFNDVTTFFQNVGSFGQSMLTTINGLGTAGANSTIKLALSENSDQETTLADNTSALELRLTSYQASLTTELNTANQILQGIPGQLDEVNQIFDAITGNHNSNN
ncbi:flagellar filament capping protein FliD [Terriglobus saanensis]|uniref:Flagellar hook-associated protein 2 n=1 Tax=Terriglobus saanensis (strain ATCC BAA-1853 / DSM 23119 / SP1PR4) TaxID=401053 RepID=E8UWZ2_TERSS|nr:flagellar filament capping protein FliD [Terriglobus saanensis]ADV81879.1 flagellar hook-associated 2 domain-containing protein [Terriglobus saanensis SP1PR4]